jgi:hypothetical protein
MITSLGDNNPGVDQMDVDDDLGADDENEDDENEDNEDDKGADEDDNEDKGADEDDRFIRHLENDYSDQAQQSKEELDALMAGGAEGGRKRSWGDSLKFESTLDVQPIFKEMPVEVKNRLLEYGEHQRVIVLKSYMEHFFGKLELEGQLRVNRAAMEGQFWALQFSLAEAVIAKYPSLKEHEVKEKVMHLLIQDFEFPRTVDRIFKDKDKKAVEKSRRTTRSSSSKQQK